MEQNLELAVNQRSGEISFNFDSLKEAIDGIMSQYMDLAITEDGIPSAKEDLANIRKLKKELDDKRKLVKKEWLRPYEEFEARIKELSALMERPEKKIADALKEFEAGRIAEKQEHLRKLYDEAIGEYREFLPYEAVSSDRWNNKTTSDKSVIADISERKTQVMADLEVIRSLRSEIEEELVRTYRESGNQLSVAIRKNSDYADAKRLAERKIGEERRAREEASQREMEAALNPAAGNTIEDFKTDCMEEADMPSPPEPNVDKAMMFRIYGEEGIERTKQFLEFNEIMYEVVC